MTDIHYYTHSRWSTGTMHIKIKVPYKKDKILNEHIKNRTHRKLTLSMALPFKLFLSFRNYIFTTVQNRNDLFTEAAVCRCSWKQL